jgi:predicted PurR-regulated permease PerM
MAGMNIAGLYILGIEHAIILGVIVALLNVIPYIGGIVGTLIPIFASLTQAEDLSLPFYILLMLIGIQFIDNNFISPYVVGSKVRLNALFCIIGVLLGGFIWGVAGMFLSIPFLAILKVIFDRVDGMRPFGQLLGAESQRRNFKFHVSKRRDRELILPEALKTEL